MNISMKSLGKLTLRHMNNLEQAIDVLKQGGIIIYPTDTAFGIGCRIDDSNAVQKLFTIRKRPLNNPTPVLFDSVDLVRKYVKEIPENAQELMDTYWPGALTLVLGAKTDSVNSLVERRRARNWLSHT